MKHYSASAPAQVIPVPRLGEHLTDAELAAELLERARKRAIGGGLLTEREVAEEIAGRLDGRNGEHGRLAADIGIAQGTLSSVLHSSQTIGSDLARKLGYRRVVRFERIG